MQTLASFMISLYQLLSSNHTLLCSFKEFDQYPSALSEGVSTFFNVCCFDLVLFYLTAFVLLVQLLTFFSGVWFLFVTSLN